MISSILLANLAFGTISIPEYSFAEGENNLFTKAYFFIDVCNSLEPEMWKKGSFDWSHYIFRNVNSEGLVIDTPVGPSIVREEMSVVFPQIEDGPDMDDKEDSQMVENKLSTFQWYIQQLEKCTKSCYEDGDCYATWAYMKDYVQMQDPASYYPELTDSITADGRYQTWFACHMLNDSYLTKLRDVVVDEGNIFKTVPMASNADVYDGSSSDREDQNVLASHYWVKPAPGVSYCNNEDDFEVIHLLATVRIHQE